MKGVRYEKEDITKTLKNVALKEYFNEVDMEEFINLIYGEDEIGSVV